MHNSTCVMAQNQASADCATILKRGYLTDKKSALMDRKRWYILRQDVALQYCVLEFYKDERSATKGDAPKGFINVHDIVEVHRIVEKKQTLEILCPGVGYRMMASSEAETDDWVEALKKLICYRKEGPSTLNRLQPVSSFDIPPSPKSPKSPHTSPPRSQTPVKMLPACPNGTEMHLSQSPPFTFITVPPATSVPPPPPADTLTPSITSPTNSIPVTQPVLQNQKSVESTLPFPSPPSSSSESSVSSGFNVVGSDHSPPVDEPDSGVANRFRVQVKEAEILGVPGSCDLVVSEDAVFLFALQSGQPLVSWPIASLRKYGASNSAFTIVSGRNCNTGEGRFQFITPQSRLIHAKVHAMAMAKATVQRKGSQQGTVFMDSIFQPQSTQSLPHGSLSSQLPRTVSVQDQYGQLSQSSGTSQYSKLSHTHSSPGSSSSMVPSNPISIAQQRPPPPPPSIPTVHMCSQCSAFQAPALMASGQIMFLSSSPCHHMHPFQASPTRTILAPYPHPMFHNAVPMGYNGKSASFEMPYPHDMGRQVEVTPSPRIKPGRSHSSAALY